MWLVFQYMRTLKTIWLYLTGLRLSDGRFGMLYSLTVKLLTALYQSYFRR